MQWKNVEKMGKILTRSETSFERTVKDVIFIIQFLFLNIYLFVYLYVKVKKSSEAETSRGIEE
jgi:regulatory protein YycI of two-component signal transduction system YycFG